jgi:hypothetical protein
VAIQRNQVTQIIPAEGWRAAFSRAGESKGSREEVEICPLIAWGFAPAQFGVDMGLAGFILSPDGRGIVQVREQSEPDEVEFLGYLTPDADPSKYGKQTAAKTTTKRRGKSS